MTGRSGFARLAGSPTVRVVAILLVLGAQVGMLSWYASLDPAPEAGDYPGGYDLQRNYERWIGERASLAGTVTDTDPVRIEVGGAGGRTMVVEGAPPDAEVNDKLRLFATVRPDDRLEVIEAFAIPPGEQRHMYFVSFLAGLWALWRLLRHWRFDLQTWGLVPRAETESTVDHGARSQTGSDDA